MPLAKVTSRNGRHTLGGVGNVAGPEAASGPGTPREEVERNQRERLFGAIVACMAAKGYEATTVADLTEISGVSSRTFYDLFSHKKACFLEALQAMIKAAIGFAAKG